MVAFSRPLYIVLGMPKNRAALHKLQDYYNTERMGIGISIQATPKTRWRGLWVGWERKPRQLTPSSYSGSPAAADPGIRVSRDARIRCPRLPVSDVGVGPAGAPKGIEFTHSLMGSNESGWEFDRLTRINHRISVLRIAKYGSEWNNELVFGFRNLDFRNIVFLV